MGVLAKHNKKKNSLPTMFFIRLGNKPQVSKCSIKAKNQTNPKSLLKKCKINVYIVYIKNPELWELSFFF